MSDEISMANQISVLKEKLDKIEGENAELKEQIAELTDKNSKLLEEIETMKMEKFQNDPVKSINSNQISQMLKHKSTDSKMKMDAKRAKIEGKSVPNWLIEVLAWIKRVEMADSKLSTSNWTFKQLCWPKLHGNVKPHNVEYYLQFKCELNESGIYQAKLKTYKHYREVDIPIACIQPPNYITGFCEILINFLDGQVMRFIECIHSKLNAIKLNMDRTDIQICHSMERLNQFNRLFKMLAEKATSFCNEKNLFKFLRFNPNAFGLIENIQALMRVRPYFDKDIDLLVHWLNKSLPDKKPKIFRFIPRQMPDLTISMLIDKIKEQFIGSKHSANFIIPFYWKPNYQNFSMENEQIGEILTLYTNENGNEHGEGHFLVRHSKSEEHLKEDWEKQMLQLDYLMPYVDVKITGFGEF